mmetsp:Transcript_12118/g.33510  ORF Transcript_12118/g.33510 Transcript_12118/m.33510 type:complete len:109 (-) Transcript_12118:144-470(-)
MNIFLLQTPAFADSLYIFRLCIRKDLSIGVPREGDGISKIVVSNMDNLQRWAYICFDNSDGCTLFLGPWIHLLNGVQRSLRRIVNDTSSSVHRTLLILHPNCDFHSFD